MFLEVVVNEMETSTERILKGLHDSLLKMTMGILGEVVFYQILDTAVQLFPYQLKVLLRGTIPPPHEGTDVLLYDTIREIVR
jgi:hypothetical protein